MPAFGTELNVAQFRLDTDSIRNGNLLRSGEIDSARGLHVHINRDRSRAGRQIARAKIEG